MEKITKEYIAHSENSNGIKQTIKEHSSGVSEFMREFALSESYVALYEFCGLTHDIGKYSNAFQKHISGENIKTKHSIYAAMYAQDNSLMEVAFPVFGHHAGLPDNPELRQNIEAERDTNDGTYIEILANHKIDTHDAVNNPDDTAFWNLSDILLQELFVRMLFSALVDADSLDTERHFQEAKFLSRPSQIFDPTKLLEKLQRRFDSFENDPKKKELKINRLRNEVRLYAESKANLPQGFFSLTLPTGLGKTLGSINWALHHAQRHPNIKRIIIVLPFINIIDQTADELKKIFNESGNDDYVLEHHSNVIYTKEGDGEDYYPKQLATENWDYPIIITTSVQFFESLFSNARTTCRKLHNIQDSIIIFDEIQTLPMNVTEPTLIMLDNLQRLCRCSILFCTATQPDFEARDGFRGIHLEPLVENPKHVFEETKRVVYHPLNGYEELPISELAEAVVKKQVSALVVFNTKKKARMFFEEMRGCDGFTLFHLSTNMCPSHRKRVIRDIRHALEKEERIVVSSTQLIEAGVDMDFPTVYRELAPLESIIQSAGRCNREGKVEKGDVYLFALTESGQPSKQYRSWAEFANLLYKGNEEILYTNDFYSFYYRKLVENFGDTDEYKITEDRKRFLFQTVADKYKVIDNNTQPIFVYQYDEKSRELYNRIKNHLSEIKRGSKNLRQNDNLIVFVRNNHEQQPWVARIKDGLVTDSVSMSDLGIRSSDGENRASDPAVMEGVMHYAFSHYPATSGNYGLVIEGHGCGWLMKQEVSTTLCRAIAVDNGKKKLSSDGRWINIPTMAAILKNMPHLKFIMTDCCNMMCLENLYELRNVCDYMIGSPAEIPGPGAPYDLIVPDMFSQSETFYANITGKYYNSLEGGLPLVAVKTSEMEKVAQATRIALLSVREELAGRYPDMKGIIHYYHTNTGNDFLPEYNIFYDAGDFMQRYAPADVYRQWKQVLNQAIVECHMATFWDTDKNWQMKYADFIVTEEKFHGVSMFVPQDPDKGDYAQYNEDIKQMAWYAATM